MRQKIMFLLAGMALGMALLSGGSALASVALTAYPSNHTFYVDGRRVTLTAYEIGGNNYLKLRDIGQAVGFNVYWDGTVQIESDKPYTGVGPVAQAPAPAPASTPAPQTITEESVRTALIALREQYPNGTVWPSPRRSASGGPYGASCHSCAGWAILCSDAAFGNLPWRRVDRPSWEQLRPGDLVEYDNDLGGHVIVVVSKTSDTITFTDSGPTQKAYWGGQYPRWWLEKQPGLILYTRYPS